MAAWGRSAVKRMPALLTVLLSAGALVALLLATEPTGYALFLLAAVTLHETGHLAAFLLCGERLPTFRGRGFGFLMTPQGGLLSYKKELAIAAAGPLFNLAACLCLLPALRAGQAQEATFCFFAINLLTAGFNLLPIGGFDGGRILSALLMLLLPPRAGEAISGGISLSCSLLFYFCAKFVFDSAKPKALLLTDDERAVLREMAGGKLQKQIDLFSQNTITKLLKNAMERNLCKTKAELLHKYLQENPETESQVSCDSITDKSQTSED